MSLPPNQLVIRAADALDSPAISELIIASARLHILPELSLAGGQHLLSNLGQESIARYQSQGYQYVLALAGGRCVGVAGVRLPSHLYHLFVRAGWENQGIGRVLWQHVRDQLLGRVAEEGITVNASLNATAFYQQLGFQCQGPQLETEEVRYQPMIYTVRNPETDPSS